MNVSKRLRIISIPIATAIVSAGLIATASPSYAAAPRYRIFNVAAGQNICLGNNSSGQSHIVRCTAPAKAQEWHIHQRISLGGRIYVQWENDSNKCLGLAGGSGPQLVVGACGSTTDRSQFWHGPPILAFNGQMMENAKNGNCAGTKGSRISLHTLVIEGPCIPGSRTQLWNTTFG